MKLVPYDDECHRGFVLPTFSMQAGLPGATIDRLIRAGANVLVLESSDNLPKGSLCPDCGEEVSPFRCATTGRDHWVFLGWAGLFQRTLVWCYVKTKLTPLQLDPTLMEALKVDTTRPIPCLFKGTPLRMMGKRYGWSFDWQQAKGQDAAAGLLGREARP